MNSIKTVFCLILSSILVLPLAAQTSFSQGEELFMQNKPQEALKYLEATVSEDPAHVQAFLYLGITYLQLNRADDAINTYLQILPRGGKETSRIAFNLGNAYFTKGAFALAIEAYSQALKENQSYASAYLNRANALVRNGDLNEAVNDYETYLQIEPFSPKRGEVMRLIAFIREEFAAAEQRRIQAEETAKAEELARIQAEEAVKAAAEMARIRAEEEAKAEAERRRRLLQEVTESLQAAADDSKGLSAGTENVQDYDNEFILE